ncbi:hypothetical protein [Nocardioides kribbensis]|uniref:Uncharacterized protein n=1 Tax=Nocardioides kribbensis TaxID=305517 RepID=A0ABV1NYZ4_9ACTN
MTTDQWYDLPQGEREFWIADWELDRAACAQCGGDPETCGDSTQSWFPQRSVCFTTMERAAAHARYQALHEELPFHDGTFTNWAEGRSALHPYRFDEGVNVWVAPVDMTPGDKFLTDAYAPASAEQ